MKSKFTKILCLVMGAILLVTGTVAATLAYLKAETDPVTNTMTVGEVEIKLDEAEVDEYGAFVEGAPRRAFNEYKLIPGQEYNKDPMITVDKDSEKSHIYFGLYIDPEVQAVLDATNNVISEQIDDYKWVALVDKDGKTPMYYYGTDDEGNEIKYTIYRYEEAVDPNGTDLELHIFDKFSVAADAAVENANEGKIMLKAFAVQYANLENPLDAWLASGFAPISD
jgi:hypothetical protein